MNPQLLPANPRDDGPAWERTPYAFLAEKERRSGSRRTVESYARMLWPFFGRVGSPERVTPALALAWAHGIGASGREPSAATVGARIACLSSFYRFLSRMGLVTANPCDALERPRTVAAPARGYSAVEVRRLLAVLPDTIRGRRDRAILLTLLLTGRRRAEVMGLRAADLNLEGETVFYSYRGKGAKAGRRELPDRPTRPSAPRSRTAARTSRRWTPRHRSGRPQPVRRASAAARSTAASARTCGRPAWPPTGVHITRHTAAELRRDAGESIEAVSAFLDHSSLAVTTVYLRRLEGDTDRTWADVAAAIGM